MTGTSARYLRPARRLAPRDVVAIDGAKLRRRRRELELSQREVGEVLNVSQPAVAHMERGVVVIPRQDAPRLARLLQLRTIRALTPEDES